MACTENSRRFNTVVDYPKARAIVFSLCNKGIVPFRDAEDCVQEAVLALWQDKSAIYSIIDYLRSRAQSSVSRRGHKVGIREYFIDDLLEDVEEEYPDRGFNTVLVLEILNKLISREQELLLYKELYGTDDAAKKLGLTLSSLYSLKSRLVKKVVKWADS